MILSRSLLTEFKSYQASCMRSVSCYVASEYAEAFVCARALRRVWRGVTDAVRVHRDARTVAGRLKCGTCAGSLIEL